MASSRPRRWWRRARTGSADLDLPAPPGPASGCVVVLLGATDTAPLDRTPWSAAEVLLGATDDAGLEELHTRLVPLRRVDLVLDVRRGGGQERVRALRRLLPHLTVGGHYVALRDPAGSEDPLVRRLAAVQAAAAPEHAPGPWRRLARCLDLIEITDSQVVARMGTRALLKVPDDPAATLLARREPTLRVSEVHSLPGGLLRSTGGSTHHGDHDVTHQLPSELAYPRAVLRHYEGEVVLSNAHASHGRSLLPESFRWHLTPGPESPGTIDLDDRFALLRSDPADPADAPLLPGSYYHLDYANTGHYGHLMTEAVARLWGWHQAKAADPGLKLLLRHHPQRKRDPRRRPESVLLPGFGVDADDLVWFDGSVRVESLLGTTPLWHNADPHHAHPALRETWTRLREGLLAHPTPSSELRGGGAERIFVTRHEGNRPCRNVAAVEALVTELGYTVVSPAGMDITEQAAIFSRARVVAGFGGTGMFNLVFAEHLESVVVLNHTSYDARNEHLFAALHDADIHFFWSEPDLHHPEGSFSYDAFQSPWEVDLAQHEATLRDLLPRL